MRCYSGVAVEDVEDVVTFNAATAVILTVSLVRRIVFVVVVVSSVVDTAARTGFYC